jgi:hypothetical protein
LLLFKCLKIEAVDTALKDAAQPLF